MADHDLALPEATFEPRLSIARSTHKVDDVNNMIWHDGHLVVTVVSDLKEADLSIFLAALARSRRQDTASSIHSIMNQEKPMGAPT